MTKKRKRRKKLNSLFAIPLFMASIVFIYAIFIINILIPKYLLILIGIILFIDIFNLFLLKRKSKGIRRFATLCTILFTAAMLLGSNYIFKTNGILIGSNLDYKTYDFSVLVLKDSSYQKLSDLESKTMGYYEIDNVDSNEYLDKINKKIDVTFEKSNNYSDLTNQLLNKKVESIIIENSYLSMLDEGEISTFNKDTRTIYKFSIRVKADNISKDIDVTKKPFNIYISAMDEYGTISSVSRSDVNIVVTVNPKTRQILLTSIPRDYYVQLHNTTGYKDKLTHAGLYGIESSVSTIEDLLDIDINYYIKVNFTSLVKIIDGMGGVEVYSEYDFTSRDDFHYSKGYNKVNGEEALSFARERKAFAAGDNQRGRNQQALLEAMIRKCTSTSIIYKYNSLLNSINGSFMTNMSSKRITSLVKMQLADMKPWTITSNNLTGSDGSAYTYSYSSQKLYVMIPNEDSIKEASNLIEEVMNNETLESSYNSNSSNVHSVYKVNTNKNTPEPKKETKSDIKQEEKEEKKEESKDNTTNNIDNDNNIIDNTGDNNDNNNDNNDSDNQEETTIDDNNDNEDNTTN